MKKIILMLSIVATFAACSDDPTTPGQTKIEEDASVEGTWNFNKQTQAEGKTFVNGTLVSTYTAETAEENGTIQFNAEGNYGSNFGYKTFYTVDNNGSPSSYDEFTPPTASGGTYVHNKTAGTITLTAFDGSVSTLTINELTSSKLVYTTAVNTSVTDGETTTTTSAQVTSTFSK